jgi:hypothetical protein
MHRALWAHPSVQTATDAGIFLWLAMSANWKSSRCAFGGKLIDVAPGQVVTSIQEMAATLCVPRTTLDRRLKWFVECGSIAQQVGNQGRLITLVNWEHYQGSEVDDGQPMGSEWVTDGERTGNGRTHSKKERREEEKKKETTPNVFDEGDEALAREWLAFASQLSPTVRYSPKWPNAVRQLRELDGFSLEDLRAALAFVRTDEFWRPNALSLPGLRSRSKNGLLKIENILAKIKTAAPIARPDCRSCAGAGTVMAWRGLESREFWCPACRGCSPDDDPDWRRRGWEISNQEGQRA